MTNHTASFAAGLFDGEGCVTIGRTAYGDTHHYHLQVQFHMTNRAVLEFMKQQFGGKSVHKCKRYPRRRQGYKWDLFSSGAARFLEAVQPYSIVKRREIQVALAFHAQNVRYQNKGRPGFRKRTPRELAAREKYYWRLRLLKKAAS